MEGNWDESDYNIDWAVDHENGWGSTQEDLCHGPPFWIERWINALWDHPDTAMPENLACFEREVFRCPTNQEWEEIAKQFVAATFRPIPDVSGTFYKKDPVTDTMDPAHIFFADDVREEWHRRMERHREDTQYFLRKGRQVLQVILKDLGGVPGEVELPARVRWALVIRWEMGLPIRVPSYIHSDGTIRTVAYDFGLTDHLKKSIGPAIEKCLEGLEELDYIDRSDGSENSSM
ncbi:hypothetical protein EST38_g12078 [Candolleomyces aberdarensis]|uniref:Uncharacterized protein n=1 Tax=Candolleomyces aberdarensis TaxID=2316362 RepID=A0A4Q2D5I5_9AGAR|nr:hypothetical protein EST38_g12078 [Candolleomyces aberdarensis]